MSINKLPNEIINKIICYINISDRRDLMLVYHDLYKAQMFRLTICGLKIQKLYILERQSHNNTCINIKIC